MSNNTGFPPARVYTPFWRRRYQPWIEQSSYSGCDIIPVVYGKDATSGEPSLFVLGNIQTLTYSIHRDKGKVVTLGRSDPKGFTRGQRTIAGSIIFSVFNQRALWELAKTKDDLSHRVALADSLPGFDIILYMANEYGEESTLIIYNVQILDEGQSHSSEDLYIENTMGYLANKIDLLEPQSVNLPSAATFISNSREELTRTQGPSGLSFNYSYLQP